MGQGNTVTALAADLCANIHLINIKKKYFDDIIESVRMLNAPGKLDIFSFGNVTSISSNACMVFTNLLSQQLSWNDI